MNCYIKQVRLYNNEPLVLINGDLWIFKDGFFTPLISEYGTITDFEVRNDQVVFISDVEGIPEIFLLSNNEISRMTFFGSSRVSLAGWIKDKIAISSSHRSHLPSVKYMYTICPKTREITKLGFGEQAYKVTETDFGDLVVQKHGYGYCFRREYRGGDVGELCVMENSTTCKRLLNNGYNIISPKVYKNRIYFLTDRLGVGNVCSCDLKGKEIQQHTYAENFYVTSFDIADDYIQYTSGGKLFKQALSNKNSPKSQEQDTSHFRKNNTRNFAINDPAQWLNGVSVNQSNNLCVTTRGKTSILQDANTTIPGTSFRSSWINDKEIILCSKEIKKFDTTTGKETQYKEDLGIIDDIVPNKSGEKILLANNRHELWMLEKDQFTKIDSSKEHICDACWSPDGKWIAYTKHRDREKLEIIIKNLESDEKLTLDSCSNPIFDNSGKYFLFLQQHIKRNGCSWDKCDDIMVAPLSSDIMCPITKTGIIPSENKKESSESKEESSEDKEENKEKATKIDKEFYLRAEYILKDQPEVRLLCCTEKGPVWAEKNNKTFEIKHFSWSSKKTDTLTSEIKYAQTNGAWSVYQNSDNKIVTAKADEKPDNAAQASGETGGYWNLPVIFVDTKSEWRLILWQAWKLCKEHYNGKHKIEWDALYKKYETLTQHACCRQDINHIISQMQGELKTSHAYVLESGDTETEQRTAITGNLFSDFSFKNNTWIFEKPHFSKTSISHPLLQGGLLPGDQITHINGNALSRSLSPDVSLIGTANKTISVRFSRNGTASTANIVPGTVSNEPYYKEWISNNQKLVGDDIGYVHIPDMCTHGFEEFISQYTKIHNRKGVIIDIRNNDGGNVSDLILRFLLSKKLALEKPKYHSQENYMSYAPCGPLVLLANQGCGSDGDIFTHAFRDLQLGTIIGKRTWGGIVGIAPRYKLIDGGLTSQPEFAFEFKSSEYDPEDYGVSPDIEVDNFDSKDSQLLRAIEEIKILITK